MSITNTAFTLQQYDEAAEFIRRKANVQPQIGMILGTGLSPLAEEIEDAVIIPYQEIPHFPVSTVHGHAGRLVLGRLSGVNVCVMQGRFHFYEGYSPQQVTLPVRVMKRAGHRDAHHHQRRRWCEPILQRWRSDAYRRSPQHRGHERHQPTRWSQHGRVRHPLPADEPYLHQSTAPVGRRSGW